MAKKRKRRKNTKKKPPMNNNDSLVTNYELDGSVKKLFLNLTSMQIPFDYEYTLEKYFPENIKKDCHGNYFIKIGESDTMFCCHLDTYCYDYKKVTHVYNKEQGIIKTNGKTTLGADDKAGMVILLKMIENNVQGLYYFFRGEEGVTSPTGTWGSRQAVKSYNDLFSKYKRCIAFDRRGNNSIISEQMYSECCSGDFVFELSSQFLEYGLDYIEDTTGMWCDSGVFMDIIPECTNISVGYENEHTYYEYQDINHLEKLVEACVKIDWNNLPVERDPSVDTGYVDTYKLHGYSYNNSDDDRKESIFNKSEYYNSDEIIPLAIESLEYIGYTCLNPDSDGELDEVYFEKEDDFFGMVIIDNEIYISTDDTLAEYDCLGDLHKFQSYVFSGVEEDNQSTNKEAIELYGTMVDEYPYTVDSIFTELSKNSNILSSKLYSDLENIIRELGYSVNYTDDGINPDNYMEWLIMNRTVLFYIKDAFVNQFDMGNLCASFTFTQYYTFSKYIESGDDSLDVLISKIDNGDFLFTNHEESNVMKWFLFNGMFTDDYTDHILFNKITEWVYLYINKIKKYRKEK